MKGAGNVKTAEGSLLTVNDRRRFLRFQSISPKYKVYPKKEDNKNMLSVNSLNDVLKNFYLDVVAKQINCGASPLYDMMEKTSVLCSGRQAIIPVYYGVSGGIKTTSDDGADLPNANPCLRANLTVPLRNVYGVIDITDKALRLTRDNADGIVDVLGTEITAMVNSARHTLNRMLWTTGNGILGTVADLTSHTARNKYPVTDARLFTPGMLVDVYRGQELKHEGIRIVDVNYDTNMLVFSKAVASGEELLQNDVFYVNGSKATELHGLPYLFSSDTQYFGASKTQNGGITGTERALGKALTTEAMQDFLDLLETRSDTTPDLIVCDKALRRDYLQYLETNRTNVDYLNLDGGFKTLSYNGIPLYGEKYCPQGEMYFLKTDNFKMIQLCDWEWLEGNNGSILNRLESKAAYQAVLVKYANYVATVPNSVGRLYSIA